MSEFEKNNDEMDAAEMLEEFGKSDAAQEAERIMAEAAQEPHEEGPDDCGEKDAVLTELARQLLQETGKAIRREGWDALGLGAAYLCLAMACAVALVTQDWELTMLGMAAVSLIGAGGYAATGWKKIRA